MLDTVLDGSASATDGLRRTAVGFAHGNARDPVDAPVDPPAAMTGWRHRGAGYRPDVETMGLEPAPGSPPRDGAFRYLGVVVATVLVAGVAAAVVVRPTVDPAVRLTSGTAAFAAAADATRNAGSARVAFTQETSFDRGPGVELDGSGAFDFAAQNGFFDIQLSKEAPLAIRMINGAAYLSYPPQMRTSLGLDTSWIHIERLPPSPTASGGTPFAGTSPGDAVAALEEGSTGLYKALREMGREDVRGVETIRYSATVDLEVLSAKMAALRSEFGEPPESTPLTRMTVDFWIALDGVVRRMRQTSETGGAAHVKVVSQQEYYDFGTAVSVERPPASDVTSFPDFAAFAEFIADATASRPAENP